MGGAGVFWFGGGGGAAHGGVYRWGCGGRRAALVRFFFAVKPGGRGSLAVGAIYQVLPVCLVSYVT